MKKRTVLCVCGLLLAAALTSGAQGMPTLGVTPGPAHVDGVIADKEYSLVTETAGMKLGLTWTSDALYVGLSAPTAGWVAVGLGAAKMDGAIMYIGYVSGNETRLKVQKGSGHRHVDLETNAPAQYVMKESDGQTVLGGSDSFASFHKARAGIPVALAQ